MPKQKEDRYTWNVKKWGAHLTEKGLSKWPDFTGTARDKALAAASFLAEKGIHDFSGIELTALARWQDLCTKGNLEHGWVSAIYAALSDHYHNVYAEDYETIRADGIPAIHLLRIETDNYQGNLIEVLGYRIQDKRIRKVSDPIYPTLVFSPEDLQEGIHLPFPDDYDFQTAMLFGYYWGLGSSVPTSTSLAELCIAAPYKIKTLMESEVRPLIEKTHYITLRKGSQSTASKDYPPKRDAKGLSYHKKSRALLSFLITEHNFPKPSKREDKRRKPKYHLPNLPWSRELVNGFTLALINSRGLIRDRVYINGEGPWNQEFRSLLHQHNYAHFSNSRKPNSWRIRFDEPSSEYFKEIMASYKERCPILFSQ